MPALKYGTKTQATNGRLYSNDEANQCPSYDDFDMNAPCDYVGQCEFGEETCCGETYASLVCQCGVERSFCYYTDACLHTNCDPLDKKLENGEITEEETRLYCAYWIPILGMLC